MLQTQSFLSSLPCSAEECEGHVWHEASSLAPKLSEYLPAPHFKHSTSALLPCVGRYLPGRQFSHDKYEMAPTVLEYFPLAQLEQASSLLAPCTPEYLPAAQSEHAAADFVENLPAPHSTQSAIDVDALCGEYLPA
jgi:hypothetical protein